MMTNEKMKHSQKESGCNESDLAHEKSDPELRLGVKTVYP
jgi:hypothetical protein